MKKLFPIFLSTIFLLVSGCSHKVTLVKTTQNIHIHSKKEQQLIQRYKEYWDYFAKKQFDKAYYYELPYQRFIHPLQWYKKFNEPNDQNYTTTLRSIHLLNDYTADVDSFYTSQDKSTSFDFIDKWYLIDGKWYHLMKTSRLPVATFN